MGPNSVASTVGKFICAAKDAKDFTRPGVARCFVEVNLSKPRREFIKVYNGSH